MKVVHAEVGPQSATLRFPLDGLELLTRTPAAQVTFAKRGAVPEGELAKKQPSKPVPRTRPTLKVP